MTSRTKMVEFVISIVDKVFVFFFQMLYIRGSETLSFKPKNYTHGHLLKTCSTEEAYKKGYIADSNFIYDREAMLDSTRNS